MIKELMSSISSLVKAKDDLSRSRRIKKQDRKVLKELIELGEDALFGAIDDKIEQQDKSRKTKVKPK